MSKNTTLVFNIKLSLSSNPTFVQPESDKASQGQTTPRNEWRKMVSPDDQSRGALYFVGTATVVMEYGEMRILTDPNFLHQGEHVHLGLGFQAKRLTNPAITMDQVPEIDFIILSHFHEDHFDLKVQTHLRRDIHILTTPHAAHHLHSLGFDNAIGLNTWEAGIFTKGGTTIRITAMPGKHVTGIAGIANSVLHVLPPVMGSLLEFGNEVVEQHEQRGKTLETSAINITENIVYRIYISGDTLLCNDLKEIPTRFPNIDLALLHLGGTILPGIGLMVTMDAVQGIKTIGVLHPQHVIPIHYDDYDVFKSSLENFQKEVIAARLQDKVTYLDRGEKVIFQISGEGEKIKKLAKDEGLIF